MNLVFYGRYSDSKQTEQSIEGQRNVCYDFAERNGYTIIGEYIDCAITGKTDLRPEFQRMITDSSKKQFQGVIVYQLDRFARNRYDSATYKARLKKNGVRVLSARENISDDASGVLMEAVLEGMAEYYSVELSQKVKRGMNINAEKCLSNGGSIPLGFKIIDRVYHIDDETAPYVRQIFQMYADGQRFIDIIDYMNVRQIKTSSGAEFNKSSLHFMLKNKKYIGVYRYGDIEVPNGIPRIISDDLFYKVAEKMIENKKTPGKVRAKEEYLLTTKLFCGHCKSMMIGVSGTSSTGKSYSYYSCNGNRLGSCTKRNVPKNYIEDLVIDECRKLLTPDNINRIAKEVEAICKQEKDTSELKRFEKLLIDTDNAIENLMKALEQGQNIDLIGERITQKRTEKAEIEKAISVEQLHNISLSAPQIKFFLTQLKKGNVNDIKYRKLLVNILVNTIYLYDDRRITFIFNAGDNPVVIEDIPLDEIEANDKSYPRSHVEQSGSPRKTLASTRFVRVFCFCFFHCRLWFVQEMSKSD